MVNLNAPFLQPAAGGSGTVSLSVGRRAAPRDRTLLVVADAAAEVTVSPGHQGYLLNQRIFGVRFWGYVADLGDLTCRFLDRRVDFRAKRLAGRVLSGAYVCTKRWLEVGIADRNERAIVIPRSRQDPKIGGKDDAEIISDRIAKLAPFPRDFVA